MKILPLDLGKGMIARTLIDDGVRQYEVMTCDTTKIADAETAAFWDSLFKDYPFETVIYRLCPATKPYTAIETQLAELVPVNAELRRDLELGDLYVSRSHDEESAALEHDKCVEEFKEGTIILMTQDERAAVWGPGKLFQ